MLTAYYAIVACAIVTMVIGLKMVVGLRKTAPGGTIIDRMPDNPSAMEDGLNNVRIAVKLLFDDTLSDDIYEELRLMAKYPDRV